MPSEDPVPDRRRKKRPFFLRHLPLEHETALYLLVSVFDVLMTWFLIRTGQFYEANPVARFFLHGWGPKGMVYFKFLLVAFVCVITQIIATRRPQTAQRVLQFATVVVAGVVIYSLMLYLRHSQAGLPPAD